MSAVASPPLGRDLPCPHCSHPGHRWTPCDVCACGPHDPSDSIEPLTRRSTMKRYAKFIAAALAFAGVVASSGLLSGEAQAWVNCIIAAVGAALVYLIPNAPMPRRED